MTLRAKFREAISLRLVPELKRRGFVGPEKIKGNAVLHDFVRHSGTQTESLSIQFDKRQRPRFILNVHVEPAEGWDEFLKKGGSILYGRISPGGGIGTGAWFRADQPWWRRLFGHSASREEAAVDQAILCLDAIDDWFSNPRPTEVVSTFSQPYRGSGTPKPG